MAKSKKKSHSKSRRKRSHSSTSTDSEDSCYEHKSRRQKYSKRRHRSASSSSSEWSTSPERSEESSKYQYREIEHTRTHRRKKKQVVYRRRRRSTSESDSRHGQYFEDKSSRGSLSISRKYDKRSSEVESPERRKEKSKADCEDIEAHLSETSADLTKEKYTVSEIKKVEQKSEDQHETIKYVTTLNSSGSSQAKKIEIKISSKKYGQDENEKISKEKVDLIGKWEPVEHRSLKAFTELCKTLAEKTEEENDKDIDKTSGKTCEVKQEAKIRHPYKAPPPVSLPIIPMNPAQAIQAGLIHQVVNPIKVPVQSREIQASFPVSSGTHHRAKEHTTAAAPNAPVFEDQRNPPVNISAVIAERLQIQKKLNQEPFNVEAIAKLRECDELIKRWSRSGLKPEQFTGEKTKNILSKEELEGGYNAWIKKDFFTNLQPIRDGPGLRLLQKMGWTYGQPLGKSRAGFVNPLSFEIRTDRRGLSTAEETVNTMKPKRKGPPVVDVQGKHPVSALSEYCTKQKWPLPDFRLIMDSGPSHHKNFMFKVIVNGQEFVPASSSPNKKNAKAQAATAALQKLGLTT